MVGFFSVIYTAMTFYLLKMTFMYRIKLMQSINMFPVLPYIYNFLEVNIDINILELQVSLC